MKRLLIIGLAFTVCDALYAREDMPGLSLREVEKCFLEHNVQLTAQRYNVDRAQAQVVQARLFDNPVISLEQNVYNRLNGKYFDVGKEGEAAIEIEQEIPIARQRSKRIKLEEINREAAGYRFEEVLRTLRSKLYRSFVDTYYQSRSVRVYDREITSVGKLLQAVREQEGKGNMSRMEVSRLELFLLSLRKERQEAERQLVEMRGRLNLLLGAPAGHDRELVLDESILEKVDLSAVSFADLGTMLDSRPDVRAARAGVRAAEANVKLQRAMAAPEFSVRGMYDRAGNFINDYFAIGVTCSVPIFNRNQGEIKSAKLELLQQGKEEEYAVDKAEMELYSACHQLQKAVELYRAFDGRVEQDFEQLMEGVNENFYERNINMLEFIDYYQSYKEACLQCYALRRDVFGAMENLNTVVGRTIFKF